MDSPFTSPQVRNWVKNINLGNDEYFWDEAIYKLDRVYRSFAPLTRIVVDFKIDGKTNEEIARLIGKSLTHTKNIVHRAKQRLLRAVMPERVNQTTDPLVAKYDIEKLID